DELPAALAEVPGPPWFVKGRRGSQGSHVRLAADRDAARRWAGLFWGSGASLLVQEDLRASGRVERHPVVEGAGVVSAVALAARGEYRTNAHRGGRFVAIAEAGEWSGPAALAVRATAAIGLPFAAIDVVGGGDPRVLDVNASPGLEALEAATRRDLATPIVAAVAAAAGGPRAAGGGPGRAVNGRPGPAQAPRVPGEGRLPPPRGPLLPRPPRGDPRRGQANDDAHDDDRDPFRTVRAGRSHDEPGPRDAC